MQRGPRPREEKIFIIKIRKLKMQLGEVLVCCLHSAIKSRPILVGASREIKTNSLWAPLVAQIARQAPLPPSPAFFETSGDRGTTGIAFSTDIPQHVFTGKGYAGNLGKVHTLLQIKTYFGATGASISVGNRQIYTWRKLAFDQTTMTMMTMMMMMMG